MVVTVALTVFALWGEGHAAVRTGSLVLGLALGIITFSLEQRDTTELATLAASEGARGQYGNK
jgi:hypothetical protein